MSTLTPFTAPETPPPALPGLEASPHAPADLRPGQSSEQQAARRQAALFADELGGLFLEAEREGRDDA